MKPRTAPHSSVEGSPLSIGGLRLRGNRFLAPLAGYTDRAFRELCYGHGADLCYTEMVSAEAVARANVKSLALMERGASEELLGIQLFLYEAEQALRALPAVLRYRPSLIDINCGCPVPKVVKTGAGAALMKNPSTIYRIVATVKAETELAVTVKIRSGWDTESINYLEAARAAVDGGAAAVGLHARTRAQGYSGRADWSHIARLADEIEVPVIGSGDLWSSEAMDRMLEETGCAAVMAARGAIGNPFIFSRSGDEPEEGNRKAARRISTALSHFERELYYRGERRAVKEMKKHFAAYTKGLQDGSALRDELMRCSDAQSYRRVFSDYLKRHNIEFLYSP